MLRSSLIRLSTVCSSLFLSVCLLTLLSCWGCGRGDGYREVTQADADHAEQHAHEHDHHAHAAPHGGHLIELGAHQYNAEVVYDADEGRLIVYVLDAHAEHAVPVALEQIEFAVEGGDAIVLIADPQEGDPPGQASRFVAAGDVVAAISDIEDLHGSVQIEINGEQFSGTLSHDHDDHDEGHDDHSGHDDDTGHEQ